MQKESIVVGFSRPINMNFPIFSWLIRLIYQTQYSHVYIKFHSDKLQRCFIYETVGKGTRFINESNWVKHSSVVEEFTLSISDEQKTQMIQACVDNLGNDYGVMQAIGLGIKQLYKELFNKTIQNPFSDEETEICSQAAGNILEILGYELGDTEEVAPIDIYNYLKYKEKNNVERS
jgi:hypothetical protein